MPVTAKPKNWFPAQLLLAEKTLFKEMLEVLLEEMQQAVQANTQYKMTQQHQ